MSLARLVVTAVRIEGRTKAEVSRGYGVSARWVYELCRRYVAEGEAELEPRSRRPHRSPRRTPEAIEDEIVALRKELSDLGVGAGAHTIAAHLTRRHGCEAVPSVATSSLPGVTTSSVWACAAPTGRRPRKAAARASVLRRMLISILWLLRRRM